MRYLDAYTDFFKSRNRLANLALGGVCCLIPVVGVIVYMGYLEGVVRWRVWTPPAAAPARPAPPDFQFSRFMDYLSRGVWPFLVLLVAQLPFIPLFFLAVVPVFIGAATRADGPEFVLLGVASAVLYLAAAMVMSAVLAPLALRAMLVQDFTKAFNLAFARDFIRRVWAEEFVAFWFLVATSLPLVLIGYAACFVGLYPAMALVTFAHWHLYAQLYRLYLSRGGEAIPLPATAPRCDYCGYDLRGTPGPTCPECGGARLAPLRPLPPFPSLEGRG